MNEFSERENIRDDEDMDEIEEYVQMDSAPQQERKNPYNNRRNHIITIALLLAMMLVLILTDQIKRGIEQSNAAQNGLIDLITLSDSSFLVEGGEAGYYTLAGGKLYDAEPFEAGHAERFISCMYEHDEDRKNILTDRSIYPDSNLDEQRDSDAVEADPVFARILALIEQTETEHWIFYARILRVDGEYFVCVDRNVNLWTPYVLYYYSAEKDALYHLYTLSDMDIVDIRLGENFEEKMNELMKA